ncbi:hypothetical protein BHM03_00015730 [Ensete ventricosum]|nr:hypothetical protein BHM03_00015730 [Ensete ventricosum]
MMALYVDGSLTTINDTMRVIDFGSPPNQPLPDLRSRISFLCRGAVTARGWPAEDDVDLLFDRAFGSG